MGAEVARLGKTCRELARSRMRRVADWTAHEPDQINNERPDALINTRTDRNIQSTHRTADALAAMSHRQGGGRNKVLLPPINFIFKLLQQHSTVQIWLFEQLGMRIYCKIRCFDEFLNLVIDDAVEVKQSTKQDPNPQDGPNGGRRQLGTFSLGQ